MLALPDAWSVIDVEFRYVFPDGTTSWPGLCSCRGCAPIVVLGALNHVTESGAGVSLGSDGGDAHSVDSIAVRRLGDLARWLTAAMMGSGEVASGASHATPVMWVPPDHERRGCRARTSEAGCIQITVSSAPTTRAQLCAPCYGPLLVESFDRYGAFLRAHPEPRDPNFGNLPATKSAADMSEIFAGWLAEALARDGVADLRTPARRNWQHI